MQVVYRSKIQVHRHPFGFRFRFIVKLENGDRHLFQSYANTAEKALETGIRMSERLIEKGFEFG